MSFLVTCRLCGGKVSSTADRCPHCGEPHFLPDMPTVTFNVKIIGKPDLERLVPKTEGINRSIDYGRPYARDYDISYEISLRDGQFISQGDTFSSLNRRVYADDETFSPNVRMEGPVIHGTIRVDFKEQEVYYEGDGDSSRKDVSKDTKLEPIAFKPGDSVSIVISIEKQAQTYEKNKYAMVLGFPMKLPTKQQFTKYSYRIGEIKTAK